MASRVDSRHSSRRLQDLPPLACGSCRIRGLAVYRKVSEMRPVAVEAIRVARVHFKKGHLIRSEGDANRRVHTLHSGWAVRFRTTRDGRRQILGFYLPGDLIGLECLGADGETFGVRALTDLTLCEFDSEQMLALLVKTKESAADLVSDYTRRCAEADETNFALGQGSAAERLVQLVASLRARLAAKGMQVGKTMSLPLRRDDFADALGLTPVHVSRTLAKLRREGILDFARGAVTILNETKFLASYGGMIRQ